MDRNSSQRSYHIQNSTYYFYAGYLENGNLVLMGIQQPKLVMVEFDPEGNYLKTSDREVFQERLTSGLHHNETREDILLSVLLDWQRDVAFRAGTISVKPFFLPELDIGIEDLPEHYQEVLDHPEQYDAERLTELQGDIRDWRERGSFVLYWVEDYYLDRDGDVESS